MNKILLLTALAVTAVSCKDYKDEFNDAQLEITQLENTIKNNNVSLAAFKAQLASAVAVSDGYKSNISSLDAVIVSLKEEIAGLESDGGVSSSMLADLKSKLAQYEADLANATSENAELSITIVDLSASLQAAEDGLNADEAIILSLQGDLNEALAGGDDISAALANANSSIASLQATVAAQSITIADLQAQMGGMQGLLDAALAANVELEAVISGLQADAVQLNIDLEFHSAKNREHFALFSAAADLSNQLAGQVNALNGDIREHMSSIATLEAQAVIDTDEIERLNGLLTEANTEIARLVEELRINSGYLESAQTTLAAANNNLAGVQGQLAIAEDILLQSQDNTQIQRDLVAELKVDLATATATINMLQDTLANGNGDNSQLQADLDELRADYRSSVDLYNALLASSTDNNVVTELEEDVRVLGLALGVEQARVARHIGTIATLQAQIATLTAEVAVLGPDADDDGDGFTNGEAEMLTSAGFEHNSGNFHKPTASGNDYVTITLVNGSFDVSSDDDAIAETYTSLSDAITAANTFAANN